MRIEKFDDHVLPRPVSALSEYASSQARRSLADKLSLSFKLPPVAAVAIANAVVDPAAVRKSIGDTTNPAAEQIRVQGGTLHGIRTMVWTRKVMPDPRNPRTGPSRRHPFAIDPGKGGVESRFRPIPEPRMPDVENPTLAHLAVDIENREHLNWGCQQAAAYVLAANDWRESIRSQGIMEAVWLVPTTYVSEDGTEPVTALTTAEGSSRITAVHDLLEIRSADVPYDVNDAAIRARVRKLNASLVEGPEAEDLLGLRCEQVPALILVGFTPHERGVTGFPTAVKSWVALRHVDPPRPWGEGPENESLADEVLDELHRRGLISRTERDYYAGACTKMEAIAARLSPDPVRRAASIVRLMTIRRPEVVEAIRVAVTSQSTRKRVNSGMLNALATALILRAVALEPARVDQIRRYMRHAYGKVVHKTNWAATGRDIDELVKAAQAELRESISAGATEDEGPASVELAVRSAYALIVDGKLAADKGTANNTQPDRRSPSEVLDAMRQSRQGIFQLGQSLKDLEAGIKLRAVDENGAIRKQKDGNGDLHIHDDYLRSEFPAGGQKRAPRPGDTPMDRYHNKIIKLGDAMAQLHAAFLDLAVTSGDDGCPVVDSQGVDHKQCANWREMLGEIDENLVVWSRSYRKFFGNEETAVAVHGDETLDDKAIEDEWRRRQDDGPESGDQPIAA